LGGDGGAQALDNNFCCPEWAQELRRRIYSVWNQDQPEAGRTEIMIEIRRDGSFSTPEIVKSSGRPMLDIASRAVFDKERLRLERLPEKYVGDTLKVRLVFEYKR
jgi:outer membrane biosynthesis protein TonB